MKKWKIWTGLVILFLSGVLIGGLASGLYIRSKIVEVVSGEKFWPPRPKLVVNRLTREIGLTPDQQAKILVIVEQFTRELIEVRRETRQKIAEILDQSRSEMKKHLTPDQQKKLDEFLEKIRMRKSRSSGKISVTDPSVELLIDEMKDRLHITESQADRVRPILEEARDRRRVLYHSFPREKRDSLEFQNRRQQIRVDTREQLAKILSPEQVEEYNRLQKELRWKPHQDTEDSKKSE
jgi:Spy/CpxP family protein refolding chaperone